MTSKDGNDPKLPTYQDAQDEIEELAGCIRFELLLYLIGGPLVFLLVLMLLR